MQTPSAPQPDYGFDGPRGIALLLLVSVASAGTAVWLCSPQAGGYMLLLGQIALLVVAADCLLLAGSFVWYSKVEKQREAERLLDLVPWRGEERVLDVGCGRGLLLISAVRRLTSGRAVGVDVWHGLQLSGNRPQAVLENARRAGVAERVEIQDSDARNLPFPDASFDVVLSSLVLHNIPSQAGRRQSVREIARVLKPGGHVALLDMRHTMDYVRVLCDCGLVDSRRQRASWFLSMLFPLLSCGLVRFYRVTARKPKFNHGLHG
ncbi:MAG TPA: class I SAM-dependent methyltransferase [Gemmataceae bacterium]|nr:class I SAM-dependent methyltransferase [Gemmataceae bacterium]